MTSAGKVYIYPSLGKSYSMQRYVQGVISGLVQQKIPYEIVQPSGTGLWVKYVVYPWLAYRHKKHSGKHLVISERYAYLVPFMAKDNGVVCHDLHTLYPQAKTPAVHRWLYRFFLRCMRQAQQVICVSAHTRNELLQFVPRFQKHAQVKVVPNGIEPFWSKPLEEEVPKAPWMKVFETYQVLLSVGTDAWYKNNRWSLQLLKNLPEGFHLLRVGGFNDANQHYILENGLKDRITSIEHISDLELKWTYHHAWALLFPSISEGFGWPALEAALCGCAVVADKQAAISEVLGDTDCIPLDKAQEQLLAQAQNKQKAPGFLSWEEQVERLLT